MINAQEIAKLREHIGPDGKLIIDDSLTEKQKERFNFINSLDIDIISVLSTPVEIHDMPDESEVLSIEDDEENETSDIDMQQDIDNKSDIVENNVSVDDLNSFF